MLNNYDFFSEFEEECCADMQEFGHEVSRDQDGSKAKNSQRFALTATKGTITDA